MFKSKRFFIFLPTVCLVFLTGAEAQAGFIYSNTSNPSSQTFGGSTVTITGVGSAGTLTTPTFGVIFRVADASTTIAPATDTATIFLTEAVSITNVPPAGTAAMGTINVTGNLQFIRSDSGGEVSIFTPSAASFSSTIGGVVYTLSNFSYTGPTVNGQSTATSALFTSSVVTPEPASLAMMGLGIVGVGLFRRRLVR